MTDFVATEPVWLVLVERAELIAVETGQQFTSSQVVELFTDQAEAEARAVEVGWQPDDLDGPLQYNVI
jgi:hypothetical protein